ncbi:MAG: hypothetical protein H0V68_01580 [Actinobacteria bacterium]|nr:hypothetical protein [Actinomycetota bacterium]
METRQFDFRSDLKLVLRGSARDLRHFEAEYGPGVISNGVDAEAFVTLIGRGPCPTGRYKSVRWGVSLIEARPPLRMEICLRGRPRSFGLSLVQGYFVEPFLSLLAPDAGCVLLPAAGFCVGGRTFVLMGRSRVGKSSVAARVLAAGHVFLGDDQIFLDAAGQTSYFPRRLRFYSDVETTAPAAYRALRARVKAGLQARKVMRRATRGYVAPPVRVHPSSVGPGARASGERFPVDVVVHVVRGESDSIRNEQITAEAAVDHASELLQLQRAQLVRALPALRERVERVAASERDILEAAFASVRTETLFLPDRLTASAAIDALAQRLGV